MTEARKTFFDPIKQNDHIVIIFGGEGTRYNHYHEYKEALSLNLKNLLHLMATLEEKASRGQNIDLYLPFIYNSEETFTQDKLAGTATLKSSLFQLSSSDKEALIDSLEDGVEQLYLRRICNAREGNQLRDLERTSMTVYDIEAKKIQSRIESLRDTIPLTHVFLIGHGSEGGTISLYGANISEMPLMTRTITGNLTNAIAPLLKERKIETSSHDVQVYVTACHGEKYPGIKHHQFLDRKKPFTFAEQKEYLLKHQIKALSICRAQDSLDAVEKLKALVLLLKTGLDYGTAPESFYVEPKKLLCTQEDDNDFKNEDGNISPASHWSPINQDDNDLCLPLPPCDEDWGDLPVPVSSSFSDEVVKVDEDKKKNLPVPLLLKTAHEENTTSSLATIISTEEKASGKIPTSSVLSGLDQFGLYADSDTRQTKSGTKRKTPHTKDNLEEKDTLKAAKINAT